MLGYKEWDTVWKLPKSYDRHQQMIKQKKEVRKENETLLRDNSNTAAAPAANTYADE
jgi:hypothetical protein